MEECGGLGASVFLHKDILNHVDEIVVGEPTGKNLGIAQKGCLWLEINGKGKRAMVLILRKAGMPLQVVWRLQMQSGKEYSRQLILY